MKSVRRFKHGSGISQRELKASFSLPPASETDTANLTKRIESYEKYGMDPDAIARNLTKRIERVIKRHEIQKIKHLRISQRELKGYLTCLTNRSEQNQNLTKRIERGSRLHAKRITHVKNLTKRIESQSIREPLTP